MYPMTGSPHKFFLHDDVRQPNTLWEEILHSDQQKHPMCTAVASVADEDVSNKAVKSVGLVDAHAYSLIAAKQVTLDNGKTEKLVQIRNPWGRKEW